MKNLLRASTLLLCLSGFTAAKKVADLFQPIQQLASKGSNNATLDARTLVKRACSFGEVVCDVDYCVDTSDVCCGDGNGAYCYDGQKCCQNSDYCAPDDGVCCGSLGSCPNGYECATVDDEPGCCPEDTGCYSSDFDFDDDDDDDDLVDLDDDVDDVDVTAYTQVIYWYVYVYWYVEVWYYIEVDVETSTLSLTSTEERTSSTATVSATNSRAASSSFAEISDSVTEAATTTPDLDSIPTSATTTIDSTSLTSSTSTPTSTSGDSSDDTVNLDDLLSNADPTPTDDAASTLGSSQALWYTGIFNAFLGLFVLL